jgi:hypothetical protein
MLIDSKTLDTAIFGICSGFFVADSMMDVSSNPELSFFSLAWLFIWFTLALIYFFAPLIVLKVKSSSFKSFAFHAQAHLIERILFLSGGLLSASIYFVYYNLRITQSFELSSLILLLGAVASFRFYWYWSKHHSY